MNLSLALKQIAVFLALMLSCMAPGCGCDVEVYTQQSPGLLIIETDVLNFGDVPVGFDVTQTLTLRNEGQLPLEITGFDLSPAASNFAIEGSTFFIAAKDSVTLVVHFMPEQVQDYEATVRFSHDGNNQDTSQVILRGNGVSPFRCEPCGNNPTECFNGTTLISYVLVGDCVNEQCLYEAIQEDCECGCDTTLNICVPCEGEDAGTPITEGTPVILSIDGDGTQLPPNPQSDIPLPEQTQEALHRLREHLIVQGENLDTVVEATLAHHDSDLQFSTADTLSFAEGRTAMQIKINLPQNLVTGLFTLSLVSSSTTVHADVYLLQGEPGFALK